jgi:hypothetical protein
MNVWVKVGDSQEHKIRCELSDDIANLKENIKNKLSPLFDSVPVVYIIIRDNNNNILEADDKLSDLTIGSSKKNCFLVDAPSAPITQGKIAILFIFYCYLIYTFPILVLIFPIQL